MAVRALGFLLNVFTFLLVLALFSLNSAFCKKLCEVSVENTHVLTF